MIYHASLIHSGAIPFQQGTSLGRLRTFPFCCESILFRVISLRFYQKIKRHRAYGRAGPARLWKHIVGRLLWISEAKIHIRTVEGRKRTATLSVLLPPLGFLKSPTSHEAQPWIVASVGPQHTLNIIGPVLIVHRERHVSHLLIMPK